MCGVCGQRHFEHLMRAAGTQQRCWLACSRYALHLVTACECHNVSIHKERDVVGTFLSVGLSVRHTQMHSSTMSSDVFFICQKTRFNVFLTGISKTYKVVSKSLVLNPSKLVQTFALVLHLIFYHLLPFICFYCYG